MEAVTSYAGLPDIGPFTITVDRAVRRHVVPELS
jgi:hypothetical protein